MVGNGEMEMLFGSNEREGGIGRESYRRRLVRKSYTKSKIKIL